MPGFFAKEQIIAAPGFNRWRIPPASIAIHLCIGSVYAWSIFNTPLTRVRGVVASAAGDWTLRDVVWIFSVAIVCLGLSAAVAGKWMEKVGPRTVGIVATGCWGSGFLVGALGIWFEQLWLVYLGYGVIGGCGLGLGYVSPVSTLIRWFPDRRGMATGMAIMGFGGGAMLGAPLKEELIQRFYRQPQVIEGDLSSSLVNKEGVFYATVAGAEREVIVISEQEVPDRKPALRPGAYLVGTGRTGVAETFVVLGIGHSLIMILAALSYRLPAPDWKPAGWIPPDDRALDEKMISTHHVTIDEAVRTPQFYLLWIVLCFNVTAGIGILGVAKTMMIDIFGSTLPGIVDSRFAATYVTMTSVFNMLGRFFWSSVSDYLGRKKTYTIFFMAGAALYLSIPYTASAVNASPGVVWLVIFYAVTMLIFTMYGGGFATIPSYLADLFGSRFVGGIHGRLLTAWSTAGVLGPLALTALREQAENRELARLAALVAPAEFAAKFGLPPDQLPTLIEKKAVTITGLMSLLPADVPNPSSTLYNTPMYVMALLLLVALGANLMVRPVDPRHHMKE
jgi:MFS family permease